MAREAIINNEHNWWKRQRLRIRLLFMGQIRPMKVDDIMALVSWTIVGNIGFVLAGTTTAVSIMLFLVNSFSFEEFIAEKVCERLTALTGYHIFFETAIVPRWRDGSIRLQNVQIVSNKDTWVERKRKESQKNGTPFDPSKIEANWTYWNLTVDSIDFSLSLWRWLDGKGIVKDAKLKGVRGVCNRKHVVANHTHTRTKRSPQFGDFDLNQLVVEDLLVNIENPNFRPYTLSIIHARLPLLRQQWFLYDWLCADSIVGTLDDCLFSVNKPQTIDLGIQHELEANWSKLSHLRLYGLPIDHIQNGATGPLSWITKGTIDMDVHFLVPHSTNDDLFDKILDQVDGLKDIALNKFESALIPDEKPEQPKRSLLKTMRQYGFGRKSKADPDVPSSDLPLADTMLKIDPSSNIVMLWRLKIKDLKANVPIANETLSYMSNALIRPVVGWMNANKTLIPLSFSAKMNLNNFNGAWDIYSAGLSEVLSEEMGRAVMQLVNDETQQTKTLRQIGLWSLAEISQMILNVLELAGGDRGFATYEGLEAADYE
ncbi:Mitochondrial distribution and morphology protein 31, mitochondrial precursor [Kappamyces sp. JEL0829]|nr:Mitochondrial distribution and morphology protein 31, mitochondrial precursor [Kappamyces sp. JEL0829]